VTLKPPGAPIVRAQIQATDDDLVMVTLGARLGEEIGGEWAKRIIARLCEREDLVWVLVGGVGACPPALRDAPPQRLRFVPHQAEVRGLLACCDLYLNPPRMGGGLSVAEAMAEGLAVVSLDACDGGDKLGPEATADLDHYFERLDALLASRDARLAQGARLRERFSQTLDLERSGPSLVAACEVARERFGRRA
jgi:glycosyltransferase involved in cell wall biosynthesis